MKEDFRDKRHLGVVGLGVMGKNLALNAESKGFSAAGFDIDPEKVKKTAEQVFGLLGGALVSAMVYIGDRMGLYASLNGAGPLTSEEFARKTGLHERWIREWLYGQTAAGLLEYAGDGTRLLVQDHGRGAPVIVGGGGGGYGLTGMRERAELLGGRLDAGPTGDGFKVELWLPA